ncbi:allophanate hydrolase subunit 2 [Neokomagataea thailandica NBRC 106555]|uniref:Biotin-dependent carboxyltransferase family protein n=2 Tax=Neokomagataea TaxID=1223423 RepID=A0A4Y6VAA2_9PROT|nr:MULTISPECIES: biotin-dependent carboxyltransferase family protein [Neokomagataea]QDH25491.1 biotin-dependent carboxyltransferase family protein [Neokomagataea tanensis]GBR52226.1 allophanate hydrolase subunit 2 [Neokomagataea thailandica NBRC 106555]
MITVLETSALNTVQDTGRPGHRQSGVGLSGVMDPVALAVGNVLLNNNLNAACIEIQTYPFAVRFENDRSFIVTGTTAPLTLDGVTILPWSVAHARSGQVLRVAPPNDGMRAYLCLSGGINVPVMLGSRSTQLRGSFGGLNGRSLEEGDSLPLFDGEFLTGYGAIPPKSALCTFGQSEPKTVTLRAIPATDHDCFTPTSQASFWSDSWRITPNSNRVGYRLSGQSLQTKEPMELRSYGIVPGIMQVPPAGEPIVQMADANTVGGYPRIATVIEADLWRLAQARIGHSIRLQKCTHAEGIAASKEITSYLNDLRMMAGFYRRSQARKGIV